MREVRRFLGGEAVRQPNLVMLERMHAEAVACAESHREMAEGQLHLAREFDEHAEELANIITIVKYARS